MVATIAKIPLIQKIPVIRRFFNSRYSFQKDSLIRIQNQLDRLLTLTKPAPPPIRKKPYVLSAWTSLEIIYSIAIFYLFLKNILKIMKPPLLETLLSRV